MQSGTIGDGQISASSHFDANHAAKQGRLHFQATGTLKGGWSAVRNDANQWLQVYLGCESFVITAVATQGRNGCCHQWVTKYNLQYNDDKKNFQYYREQGESIKIFDGNTNPDSVVYHEFNPPIKARYIRFRPVAWKNHVSMRVEVYGCSKGEAFTSNFNNRSRYSISYLEHKKYFKVQ
ncbi:contactin-associated protein-like 3B [Orbicella faveolata]|uniref:contactin-associated protein-like 3B n=1 Tax=Orbicella faveolata TaxID=48498 RepID=UPI0009E30D61|nr:contactin-associated protein-like 3B [Orbicella faveolata]